MKSAYKFAILANVTKQILAQGLLVGLCYQLIWWVSTRPILLASVIAMSHLSGMINFISNSSDFVEHTSQAVHSLLHILTKLVLCNTLLAVCSRAAGQVGYPLFSVQVQHSSVPRQQTIIERR